MRFSITLNHDEDKVWVVECPSIPGCVSQGKTKQEALENIKEAIGRMSTGSSRAWNAANGRNPSG